MASPTSMARRPESAARSTPVFGLVSTAAGRAGTLVLQTGVFFFLGVMVERRFDEVKEGKGDGDLEGRFDRSFGVGLLGEGDGSPLAQEFKERLVDIVEGLVRGAGTKSLDELVVGGQL